MLRARGRLVGALLELAHPATRVPVRRSERATRACVQCRGAVRPKGRNGPAACLFGRFLSSRLDAAALHMVDNLLSPPAANITAARKMYKLARKWGR